VYLVGWVYYFCKAHRSLRVERPGATSGCSGCPQWPPN